MEEKILKMIRNHFYDVNGTPEKSAKEIAELVREFNKWKDRNLTLLELGCSKEYKYINIHNGKEYTHDELFNYWLENIKSK